MDKVKLYHVPFDIVPYEEAYRLQEQAVEFQRRGLLPDLLLTLEHPPTITIGISGSLADLHVEESFLRSRAIDVVHTNRGGKITYHGPGQLVVYPLIELKNFKLTPRRYICILEKTIIQVLKEWEVKARTIENRRGVWVDGRKIASIGIRLRAGWTMHGAALNLTADLTPFSFFEPCGMSDVIMTSLNRECNRPVDREEIRHRLAQLFAHQMEGDLKLLTPEELAVHTDLAIGQNAS